MQTLNTVLTIVQVVISVAVIVVVLMQSSKENGLSGAISGNNESYMGKTGGSSLDQKLSTATKWLAVAWVLLTLAICLL
ncbi:MAG: preprotein translocase subunit SecG [Oscillospiraceae bacterium]|nr:preprotein translocase subunit SecG [Oscillospiraceae bacterium]